MAKISAIVTANSDFVSGGGAPIFIAGNEEEVKQVAFLLERILDANAHGLKNGTYVLVNHQKENDT